MFHTGSASLRLTVLSEEANDCNGKGGDGGGNGGVFPSREVATTTDKDTEEGDKEDPEDAVPTTCVCLPRAVSPDIVPVILAYLYTDRLETYTDNLRDGSAEEYVDPGSCGAATAAEPEAGGSSGRGGAETEGGCRSSTPTGAGDREGVGLGGDGERGACGEGAMPRSKVK